MRRATACLVLLAGAMMLPAEAQSRRFAVAVRSDALASSAAIDTLTPSTWPELISNAAFDEDIRLP